MLIPEEGGSGSGHVIPGLVLKAGPAPVHRAISLSVRAGHPPQPRLGNSRGCPKQPLTRPLWPEITPSAALLAAAATSPSRPLVAGGSGPALLRVLFTCEDPHSTKSYGSLPPGLWGSPGWDLSAQVSLQAFTHAVLPEPLISSPSGTVPPGGLL